MTDLLTDLGKIAGVLAFLGYIPYLLSIVRRKTLPNPATWWIWTIMGGILFASYYLEGNREAIWVPFSYFIGPTVTGILSLKYGRNEFGSFEKYCLGGAAFSLILWQVSGPVVALTMLIMIDLIAIAPTLRKTYFKPDSEDPLAWSIFWIANTLNLYVVLASEAPTYAAIAYPLELFFLPTSIMILVIRGKIVGLPGSNKQQLQAAYTAPMAPQQQPYTGSQQTTAAAPAAAFKTPSKNKPFEASLDQLVRQGARQIISQAVAAELNELLTQKGISPNTEPQANSGSSRKAESNTLHKAKNSEQENNLSSHKEHLSTVASAPLESANPSIKLTRQMLPPYLQNNHSEEAILPWVYLKGIPAEDFENQCRNLLGGNTEPLSTTALSQIHTTWHEEHQKWKQRSIAHQRYVYLWADAIGFEHTDSHVLVIVGIRADGYRELLGLETGNPHSETSWTSMLLQIQSQGLQQIPQIAVGNSKPGLWKALNQVFPETQQQACWDRKTTSILQQLPEKLQPKVNKALWEIYRAETKSDAKEALDQFINTYQTKYPEATECLTKDQKALLTFYNFPAEHWPDLRNNSLINATFATLRMNTVAPQREPLNQPVDLTTELAITQILTPAAFKLIQEAAKQWQRIRGVKHLGDVIEGIAFIDGIRVEKTDKSPVDNQTAASEEASVHF